MQSALRNIYSLHFPLLVILKSFDMDLLFIFKFKWTVYLSKCLLNVYSRVPSQRPSQTIYLGLTMNQQVHFGFLSRVFDPWFSIHVSNLLNAPETHHIYHVIFYPNPAFPSGFLSPWEQYPGFASWSLTVMPLSSLFSALLPNLFLLLPPQISLWLWPLIKVRLLSALTEIV